MKKNLNSWPSFTQKEANLAKKVLLSNKVNYWTGQECRNFENEFADYVGCKFAVALSNGTVAIDLALKAIDIKEGDEIVVTSRTFLASVSCIVNSGAVPVFADISRDSQNFNIDSIKKCISNKTKAIMCVHLAGWPCDMQEIITLAKEKNLFVIEDCAQAHGAIYKKKSVGAIGDIGCWSFCQDKIMTTGGEGGMVTTNNKKLWSKMWSYKDHGKSFNAVYRKKHPTGFRWLHESFGTNWRMTEIQGAIGRFQLKKLKKWTKIRNRNQDLIWKFCEKIKSLRVPSFKCESCTCSQNNKDCTHGAYKCYVFLRPEALKRGWNRNRIIDEIEKRGVPCSSGSCSEVYLEKAFRNMSFRPSQRLKNAKELGETSLMFMIHPTLNTSHIKFMCYVIHEVMQLASQKE